MNTFQSGALVARMAVFQFARIVSMTYKFVPRYTYSYRPPQPVSGDETTFNTLIRSPVYWYKDYQAGLSDLPGSLNAFLAAPNVRQTTLGRGFTIKCVPMLTSGLFPQPSVDSAFLTVPTSFSIVNKPRRVGWFNTANTSLSCSPVKLYLTGYPIDGIEQTWDLTVIVRWQGKGMYL